MPSQDPRSSRILSDRIRKHLGSETCALAEQILQDLPTEHHDSVEPLLQRMTETTSHLRSAVIILMSSQEECPSCYGQKGQHNGRCPLGPFFE